jgi:hypothetical protein
MSDPNGDPAADLALPFPPRAIRARVLRATDIAGQAYAAEAIVELELELAKRMWEQGVVDPHPEAVAYAESLAAAAAPATPAADA